MNVPLSPKDPSELWKQNPDAPPQMFGQADPTSSRHLKIYIDKNWPGNDRAFELLKRLDSLQTESFMTQPRLVSIYLIDGHPLAIEQVAILKGTFGDTQIAERGRVCLGVLNEPRFGVEEGILVGSVQKGSSADAAGIRSGDLIVAMNGKKLTDFDQLVTQLRSFDVGDKIMLHIRNNGLQDEGGSRSVEVTLKGWH
jgi:S1-C subfamily serine protease